MAASPAAGIAIRGDTTVSSDHGVYRAMLHAPLLAPARVETLREDHQRTVDGLLAGSPWQVISAARAPRRRLPPGVKKKILRVDRQPRVTGRPAHHFARAAS